MEKHGREKQDGVERALVLSGGGARGAFQAGVWKWLQEAGWAPDLICGSSVGAVNAVAIGSGISVEKICRLWSSFGSKGMYRITPRRFLAALMSGERIEPLADTDRMRNILRENIDFKGLQNSPFEIIITAVHMLTSELRYFTRQEITMDHLMAASAMPILFPWQEIDGEPYWDGGIMANIPVGPVLERGAETIIIVALSPVGATRRSPPANPMAAVELVVEQFLFGSYRLLCEAYALSETKIIMVAPERMLGFRSIVNFDPAQAQRLIHEGYGVAEKVLKDQL